MLKEEGQRLRCTAESDGTPAGPKRKTRRPEPAGCLIYEPDQARGWLHLYAWPSSAQSAFLSSDEQIMNDDRAIHCLPCDV